MKWALLTKISKRPLYRGTLLRFPAKYPYEKTVDFMVFDPQDSGTGLGLIVDSGYKAGLILVCLPEESHGEYPGGICSDWLKANWAKWVLSDVKVGQVRVCVTNRPKPRLPKMPRKRGA